MQLDPMQYTDKITQKRNCYHSDFYCVESDKQKCVACKEAKGNFFTFPSSPASSSVFSTLPCYTHTHNHPYTVMLHTVSQRRREAVIQMVWRTVAELTLSIWEGQPSFLSVSFQTTSDTLSLERQPINTNRRQQAFQ